MVRRTFSEKRALRRILRAQPGKQEMFLSSSADVAIYGGARGGGKSFALLLEPLRHIMNAGFRAAFFRRTIPDLTNLGGLWDTSKQIYSNVQGARKREGNDLDWTFPSGAQFQFHHLESEAAVEGHRGAQYAFIGIDELPQMSKEQFLFLMSCNRSTCGVKPYMRATCNPQPGWVKDLIRWWLDDKGQFAREDRAGVIRWFITLDDGALAWADTPEELAEQFPEKFKDTKGNTVAASQIAISLTFIPAKLDDNIALVEADPKYLGRLMQMDLVDKKRFIEGDWLITEAAGTMFRDEYFEVVEHPAPQHARRVRYWDLAGGKKKRSDCTAGVKAALHKDKDDDELFFVTIEDVVNERRSPGEIKALIVRTAKNDGVDVEVWIEEEKGAAGKIVVADIAKALPLHTVRASPVGNEDKIVRAKPVSAFCELSHTNGRCGMRIVRAVWNAIFKQQHHAFPDGRSFGIHDDVVDGTTGAWHALQQPEFGYARASW
jgi:predicted phage terminase large subunit-like protein